MLNLQFTNLKTHKFVKTSLFSNVKINHNCFANPKTDYEIATSLMEHAKIVDASNNNWNNRDARNFQDRIFDQVKSSFSFVNH